MDFIGTKFNTPKGGILTVVGKIDRIYKLNCSICSIDNKLFYSNKSGLVNSSIPCGCKTKKTSVQKVQKVQKPDTFIGTTINTPFGVLTVVGKIPNQKESTYQLTCSVCSKDTELFPNLFVSTKSRLKKGSFPCGCGKSVDWTPSQYKTRIMRKIVNAFEFIEFVGEWAGVLTKVRLRNTIDGSIWEPRIVGVLYKNELPTTTPVRYSVDSVIELIKQKGKDKLTFLGIIGAFNGVKTVVRLRCVVDGYEWNTTAEQIIRGSGCHSCSGAATWDETSLKNKLREIGVGKFIFIGLVGKFNKVHTRVKLKCLHCDHVWTPTFNSVKSPRSLDKPNGGCPGCARSGYKTNLPGKVYLIKYVTPTGKEFIKYGITNKSIRVRSKQHTKTSGTRGEILFTANFTDGVVPVKIEKELHNLRPDNGCATKEELPSGFTETLAVRYEKDVLAIIQKYL